MPEILHTRDLEEATRALAGRYERVLVRAKTALMSPIRLPRAKLADLGARIVLNAAAFDRERDAWNKDGGTLFYYRAYRMHENIAAHHAQLVVECPLSMDFLNWMTESARETVVVHVPPNWREHESSVRYVYPDAALCERFYRLAQQGVEPPPGVREAMGAVEAGRMVTDVQMKDALGLSFAQVARIRDVMLRKREWKMVTPVMVRCEPEDETLAQAYRFIANECPVVDGAHLIVGASLSKAHRFWRVALRDLQRCGSIARRDTMFFYLLDGLEPDWRRIENEQRDAKKRLAKVAAYVSGTPELKAPAKPPRRSPARPETSLSSSAG